MRVIFDCTNINVGGGIQVAKSFLKYSFRSEDIEYYYLLSEKVYEALPFKSELAGKLYHIITSSPLTLIPGSKTYRQIKKIEKLFDPDIVFTLFGPAYWKSKAPHLVGFARPHYILKDSPFFSTKSRAIQYVRLLEIIHNYLFRKNSDYLFVENESMIGPLENKYSKKAFYIPNTYNQVFEETKPKESLPECDTFNLLTISADYPHKNLDTIPAVAAFLRNKYPDFKFKFLVTLNETVQKQNTENIVYCGSVPVEQCPDLYLQSNAMYLPTLLECFSASYVEAMYMRIPILTSDLSFARSICGEAAVYFDPLSTESIADAIYNLAMDRNMQKLLAEKGRAQLKQFGSSGDRYERFVKLFVDLQGLSRT